MRVTLKQLYLGEVLDVTYSRQVLCVDAPSCQKNNNECQGPGVKVRMQQLAPGFVQQVQVQYSSQICLSFLIQSCFFFYYVGCHLAPDPGPDPVN